MSIVLAKSDDRQLPNEVASRVEIIVDEVELAFRLSLGQEKRLSDIPSSTIFMHQTSLSAHIQAFLRGKLSNELSFN